MNIRFRVFGQLILDHVRQVGDVDPACRHIGGDQEAQRAFAHPLQHPLAIVLGKVGAQFVGVIAKALQDDRDKVDVDFGVAENDGRGRVLDFEQAHQGALTPAVRRLVDNVLCFGDVHVVAAEADKFGVGHKLAGSAQHVGREGSREHAGVDGPFRQVAFDGLHIFVKAHRQHAVGFVKDEHLKVVERKRAFEQVIQHAPGRADDDVRPLLEAVDLAAIADTAIDGHGAQPSLAADRLRFVPHLASQLARGDQDQCLAAVLRGVEPFDHGQQKGAGLAGAGARLDHHVAPGQEVGDATRLHGHQARPAGARDRCGQRRGKLLDGHIGQRVGGFCNCGV